MGRGDRGICKCCLKLFHPDPPREPALRDEKGRFVRPDIARIDAVSEPPGSDTLVPD